MDSGRIRARSWSTVGFRRRYSLGAAVVTKQGRLVAVVGVLAVSTVPPLRAGQRDSLDTTGVDLEKDGMMDMTINGLRRDRKEIANRANIASIARMKLRFSASRGSNYSCCSPPRE